MFYSIVRFGSKIGRGRELQGFVDLRVHVVRSQASCLLERLSHLAPGARAAAERRGATLRLEETRRREAQAYRLAHFSRGLSRVGQSFA